MLSQIIFFVAVVLFLILLLRRVSFATKVFDWIKKAVLITAHQSMVVVSSVSHLVPRLLSFASRSKAPRVKQPSLPPTLRQMSGIEGRFWHTEPINEKLELLSKFEEGENLYKAGKVVEAEQYFLKAAANNPGDPKIYARLGLLYLQNKNYSDAIEALKVAVKLDKHNPSRHYNLALAYYGNKDVQRAISSAREAITLDPITQKYRQLLEQLLNG